MNPQLDPKTASAVLTKDLQNILDRSKRGEPLTAQQRRLVTDAAGPSVEAVDPCKAIVSLKQLSEITGISSKWLRALAKNGALTPPGPEGYPLATAVAELVRHYQTAGRKDTAPTSGKALRLQLENELLSMKIAEQKRELLPAMDVQNHLVSIFIALRNGIQASGLTREEKHDLINDLRRLGQAVPVRENCTTLDTIDDDELTPPV